MNLRLIGVTVHFFVFYVTYGMRTRSHILDHFLFTIKVDFKVDLFVLFLLILNLNLCNPMMRSIPYRIAIRWSRYFFRWSYIPYIYECRLLNLFGTFRSNVIFKRDICCRWSIRKTTGFWLALLHSITHCQYEFFLKMVELYTGYRKCYVILETTTK